MRENLPFTSAHVASVAARAEELERFGEEVQDPHALVRAARLYTLAVRIADDIEDRVITPFNRADLTRVRDELRGLATDTVSYGPVDASSASGIRDGEARAGIVRAFREVALRIEQRVAGIAWSPRLDIKSSRRA